MYVAQCKVCNSEMKNVIEELVSNGLSPEAVYKHLQSLTKPSEKAIVKRENIAPSAIRRHMKKHYNQEEKDIIQKTIPKTKLEIARENYKNGIKTTIDTINTVSHLIEIGLIEIEELEHSTNKTDRHKFTIQYMNSIKGLIDELAKLTGDLKQEGTIDINFFTNEVSLFAEIVMQTIKQLDSELNLDNKLLYGFAKVFKQQWLDYKARQEKVILGELSPSEAQKMININTFNIEN